jgi:hypothetical protein
MTDIAEGVATRVRRRQNLPMAPKSKRPVMTEEHKEALALGRRQGNAVRHYLEALERSKPRRGRKPNIESAESQLAAVDARLAEAPPLERLHLVQQRRDLLAKVGAGDERVNIEELEAGFIEAAAAYGARKGIDYASWREVGVPAQVLSKAGIHRGGRS